MEVLQTIALMSTIWTIVEGIQCWHCIADDCSKDPSGNYKATKKACNFGQACQKVYFETLEVTEKTYISHTSTVRGCSSECKSRDDFKNCTMLQRTLSGCVRKDCCSDTDLCNSAEIVGMGVPLSVTIIACVVLQTL
ncbi:uncharacterized protein LOC128234932 [Mya arenaria]|uniref:uncharacterized protein LOC128234932 n=1 Tax=Mya arenaria TaxID=6604 RepID=UPI0022E7CECF|nr:uncharacterized protein LOC128234932 [Mya arenaria]